MELSLHSFVSRLHKFSLEVCVATAIISICSISSLIIPGRHSLATDDVENRNTVFDFPMVVILKILAGLIISKLYFSLRSVKYNHFMACSMLLSLINCFVISVTIIHILGFRVIGVDEGFAYFVLLLDRHFLIDLLAAFDQNQEVLIKRLTSLLTRRVGDLCLDTTVRVLAIGVGLRTGSHYMVTMCCMICCALVAYAVAVLTVIPAMLLLYRDTFFSHEDEGKPSYSNSKTQTEIEENELSMLSTIERVRSRIQRNMKLLVVTGLLVLHLHAYVFLTKSYFTHTHKPFRTDNVESSSAKSLLISSLDNVLIVAYIIIVIGRDVTGMDGQYRNPTPVSSPSLKRKNVATQMDYKASYSHHYTCLTTLRRKAKVFKRRERQLSTDSIEDETEHSSDEEILERLESGDLKPRQLEALVKDCTRAVSLRRRHLGRRLTVPCCLELIPWQDYDYKSVHGQSCEEVIGYATMPLGYAGPLLLDGRRHFVPIATTEGCLVASTNRGCRVVERAGGIRTEVYRDGMTRAPVISFESISDLMHCVQWIESEDGFSELKLAFDSTGSHTDLLSILPMPAGRFLHLRFSSKTGDAMGMNMVSKGVECALKLLVQRCPNASIVSMSGNACSDKKATAINWVLGRGKSVLAECRIPGQVLRDLLQVDPAKMARLALAKNFSGSASAGAIGGFNAHAANLVAAIFVATGQDVAQVVESSSCMTLMEALEDDSLLVTCTMPSLEVATVGGGTRLASQSACLNMLDLDPREPAVHLARVVAGTVLCAELNLMAALIRNEVVQAHMKFNRKCTKGKPEPSAVVM